MLMLFICELMLDDDSVTGRLISMNDVDYVRIHHHDGSGEVFFKDGSIFPFERLTSFDSSREVVDVRRFLNYWQEDVDESRKRQKRESRRLARKEAKDGNTPNG